MKGMSHPFLDRFGEESRSILLSQAEEETHADGVNLFREQDPGDCIYLVLAGEVELWRKTDQDPLVPIARIGAGDYLGDMGVIDRCARCTGARTVGETRLLRIPAEPFLEVLRIEPVEVSLEFFHQLSERLRKTNDLYVSYVLHKEKLQLVGEMAQSIIHDLRNPLTVIQALADLIASRFPEDETVNRYSGLIQEEIEYMSAMAQDLLEYAKGESKLNRENVHVADLFERLESMNREQIQKSNVDFSYLAVDAVVYVDWTRMLRVLQNLLGNALKALQVEGGTLRLEAEKLGEHKVELRVLDNGPGIPETIRDKVFDPFVRAGKGEGAGLGMAIAKKIVEDHGGTISLRAESNTGTTFRIHLPAVQ